MTDSFYASDELVREMTNSRTAAGQHILTHGEAIELDFAAAHEVEWMLAALVEVSNVRGTIRFAVASGSRAPFQSRFLSDDTFVILVDRWAFVGLLTLCLRIQSLPPLAEFIQTAEIHEAKDYRGQLLLDIAKDIVFHTDDVTDVIGPLCTRAVYQAALLHIVAHEFAHISHGHLEWKNSDSYREFVADEPEHQVNLTSRTLEMDADSSATSLTLEIIERVAATRADTLSDQGGNLLTLRRRYVLGEFLAILYLDALVTKFDTSTHPIGYARFLTVADVTETTFRDRLSQAAGLTEAVRLQLVSAFVELSGGLDSLEHPLATNVRFLDEDGSWVAEYHPLGVLEGYTEISPLLARWSRIRPLLEPFHRGGVLAPQTAHPQ
jgi:hypothetical protein